MLPVRPDRLIVCGGGRKNPTLMAELARRADVQALAAEAVGLRGDAIEAECFAFLAMRKIHDLPISFPETTGVPNTMPGGSVAAAERGSGPKTARTRHEIRTRPPQGGRRGRVQGTGRSGGKSSAGWRG